MTARLPTISVASWNVLSEDVARVSSRLVLQLEEEPAVVAEVTLERCASGRLREAYPVSEHDVEVCVAELPPAMLGPLLRELVTAVMAADPHCRRIIFAAPEGDLGLLEAAEEAGFRYVVGVDLPDAPVSLTVAEPSWVTSVDMDLDRVPNT